MLYKSKINPTCSNCEKVDVCTWIPQMDHIRKKIEEINAKLEISPISIETYCKSFWEKKARIR